MHPQHLPRWEGGFLTIYPQAWPTISQPAANYLPFLGRGHPLTQCGGTVAERTARGADQPPIADKAVVDAVVDFEAVRHPGVLQRPAEPVAVVEQRVEAADDQVGRGQTFEVA